MDPKPRIFISTVSKELRSARQLVANTLTFLGFEPVWQDVYGAEQGDLREVLRRKIAECDGLVQLVGQRFGFGSTDPAKDPAAISYTQYELLHARETGKKVWPVLLTPDFATDEPNDESPAMRENQQRYRHRLEQGGDLYQNADDLSAVETIVLKLRQPLDEIRVEWEKERRRAVRFRVLVGVCLMLLLGAAAAGLELGWWIKKDTGRAAAATAQTDKKLDAVLERNQKMEEALAQLADAEIHAKQLGPRLTPEQLRQRAYAILEDDLHLPAGSLAKELPAYALELYNRPDSSLLSRARAAYALNKFAEAEDLFVQSAGQTAPAGQAAPEAAEKERRLRVAALVGAGESARSRVQYDHALEHFRAAAALTTPDRDFIEWLTVQNRLGWILYLQGNFQEEQKLMAAAWEACEKAGKSEAPQALVTHTQLAGALSEGGEPRRGEEEYRKIIPIQERILGAENPDTLSCRSDMADAMLAQGKAVEAEKELRTLIDIWKRKGTEEGVEMLACRNNLGNALFAQSKLTEAEAEHRAVLTIRKRLFGPDHPDTLASQSNLASVLEAQGLPAEAEKLHQEDLRAEERVLGPDHPDTLMTRMNLANAQQSQGKHEEAERGLRIAVEKMTRVLGASHPTTLMARMNLGNTLHSLSKEDEAEAEFRAVLQSVGPSLQPTQTTAILARNGLAQVLYAKEKYADAEPEFRAVLKLREESLGANNPDTLSALYSLALDLNQQKRNAEAIPFAKRAAEGARQTLGPDDENTKMYQGFLKYLGEQ